MSISCRYRVPSRSLRSSDKQPSLHVSRYGWQQLPQLVRIVLNAVLNANSFPPHTLITPSNGRLSRLRFLFWLGLIGALQIGFVFVFPSVQYCFNYSEWSIGTRCRLWSSEQTNDHTSELAARASTGFSLCFQCSRIIFDIGKKIAASVFVLAFPSYFYRHSSSFFWSNIKTFAWFFLTPSHSVYNTHAKTLWFRIH